MNKNDKILVTGAGGFIGGQLVGHLLKQGFSNVRAVDCKEMPEWYSFHPEAESIQRDLRLIDACQEVTSGVDHVFNLAADMGGMGFIETHKADCMLSVLINTHMLIAARDHGVKRYLFTSSACVYAADKQRNADITRFGKKTPIRPCRKTATAGKSCSANGCAATSAKTSA